MKILLVEDHAELARSVASYLVQEHYICEVASTFDEAREKLALFSYDCVLLDIMLPDGNGINLLKLLRKEGVESSVVIISAKTRSISSSPALAKVPMTTSPSRFRCPSCTPASRPSCGGVARTRITF